MCITTHSMSLYNTGQNELFKIMIGTATKYLQFELNKQNRTEQNRTEQNRIEQNRTEQNIIEWNRMEWNRIECNGLVV